MTLIFREEERAVQQPVVMTIEDADRDGVLPIEQTRKRGEIYPIGRHIHGIDASDRTPQIGIDPASIDSWVRPYNSSGLAINGHLQLTEGRGLTPPELITNLRNGIQIQIGSA